MEKEIVLQKTTERCEVSWKMTQEETGEKIGWVGAYIREMHNLLMKITSLQEKIATLNNRISVFSEEAKTGYEKRSVDCERRLVKRAQGLPYTMGDEKPRELYYIQVIHPQTGEVLRESLATDADLQQPLFEVPAFEDRQ